MAQRLWISFELFNKNGLINHAAACAYGFLLSAAPALLFIALLLSRALIASPELLEELLKPLGFIFSVFNVQDIIDNFLSSANSGVAGFLSIIIILWTARLCALSALRGLGIVFPGQRSIFRDIAITLGIWVIVMLVIFAILFGLKLALQIHTSAAFSFLLIFSSQIIRIVFLISLALLALAAYRFVPVNPPKMKHIIPGVLTCMIFFLIFTTGFSLIISPDRYNLLYGTLGRLFLFLVNVYFFFVFFFFGAQLIRVLDMSDALLFSRFRKAYSAQTSSKSLLNKLFTYTPGSLRKYLKFYKKGELVFDKQSQGQEVYYILSGNAGVYLDNECLKRIALIEKAHFFGEMAAIVSGDRAASVKAETDLSVIALPHQLFHTILQIDPDTDIDLIRALSKRLRQSRSQQEALPQQETNAADPTLQDAKPES